MKRGMLMALLFLGAAVSVPAEEIRRLPLDDTKTVSPVITRDRVVKTQGSASVRIQVQWPVTVNLGTLPGPDNGTAGKIVYAAKMKTSLQGEAFLELWTHRQGSKNFSHSPDRIGGDTAVWKEIRVVMDIGRQQVPDLLTLNVVIKGIGTVWVDDIRVWTEAPSLPATDADSASAGE